MLLMGLVAAARRRRVRIDVLRELCRALARRGPYASSREELFPLRLDPWALAPYGYLLFRLLRNPGWARALSSGAITA